jgi:2',3'-cyclic-nucleotide 3'-phosphodiesterase
VAVRVCRDDPPSNDDGMVTTADTNTSIQTSSELTNIFKMPGSSLWLIPPPDHPLNPVLSDLVKQTSSHFHSKHLFLPHITLTSEIPPSKHSSDPQAWLNSLSFPSKDEVQVKFAKVASEDVFFRKLYIQCAKSDGLKKLASACRSEVEGFGEDAKATEWSNDQYNPHLSLMYHDCQQVDAKGISEAEALAREAGVDYKGEGELGGWTGGRVVLVPTDKSIDQWAPIATRML